MIDIKQGLANLTRHIKIAPEDPGVYRMIGEDEEVLYVGKAKNIKKRIVAYSHLNKLPMRLQRMVAQIKRMEFIIVESEARALLVENELIKKFKPRYNILLKDDKSFPHLMIDVGSDFPCLRKYRGSRADKNKYFGPFASVMAVNSVVDILQKAFLLRSCRDSVFKNRERPCLMYQIKRCSAPCVGRISKEDYRRLVNEAIKTADQKRKEAVLEAKDEAFRLKAEVDAQKAEADKEIKQRRAEISRQENRIDQKETALDRKTEALEKKEEELKKRAAEAEERLAEIDALRAKEMERLETLAGLSQEDAREVLLHKVDEELTHEKAVRVAAYETDLKENCDNIARNLIGQAVSRCAADHCSETTVSVVPLPSDEMKGRIIGREGRNIRALETATGVDLIIDDTPEAITLSSFDQTRREVARMTLERLIGDGRIHPARIEETVEKCRHDLELQMKREGERAVMELGIHGLHPDLIKLIGRLKYRTSFGQNALTHSMEVAWVAGLLAGEMGVNVTMARRAGLLHDIGKALDHEIEGSHVQIGVDICRKYKENTQIIHAIEAHHGDVEPKTPLAFIIQAADAISAARPGARRENVESYVKRLENLEEISSSFEGVEQAFAVQAGREVRILVKPDVISDDQVILLARAIAKKIEDTLDYPGQIKVNVIRESRAVEYAK